MVDGIPQPSGRVREVCSICPSYRMSESSSAMSAGFSACILLTGFGAAAAAFLARGAGSVCKHSRWIARVKPEVVFFCVSCFRSTSYFAPVC